MLYLLVWILAGYLTMFVAMYVHLVTAEGKGYKALEWWMTNLSLMMEGDDQKYFGIKLIFGLVVWPVRFIQFTLDLGYYYSMYDVYDD